VMYRNDSEQGKHGLPQQRHGRFFNSLMRGTNLISHKPLNLTSTPMSIDFWQVIKFARNSSVLVSR
jgi:hypothetical protein